MTMQYSPPKLCLLAAEQCTNLQRVAAEVTLLLSAGRRLALILGTKQSGEVGTTTAQATIGLGPKLQRTPARAQDRDML